MASFSAAADIMLLTGFLLWRLRAQALGYLKPEADA